MLPDVDLFFELLWGFLALLSSSIGNPVPEELMLVGFGLRSGVLSEKYPGWALLMLPSTLAGAIITDVILYGFGRLLGKSRLMQWLAPPKKRERIRQNFYRYGFWIFIFGRLVPGIRTTLFLSAGMMKIDFKRFLLVDSIGALVGGSLFFFLGYSVGVGFVDRARLEQIQNLEHWFAPYRPWVLIGLGGVVGAYLLYRFIRNPIQTGDPEDVPLFGSKIVSVLPTAKPEAKEPSHQEAAPGVVAPAPPVTAQSAGAKQTPHPTG